MDIQFIQAKTTTGDDIMTCSFEAQSLSNTYRTRVLLEFNGILCIFDPGGSPQKVYTEYEKNFKNRNKNSIFSKKGATQ